MANADISKSIMSLRKFLSRWMVGTSGFRCHLSSLLIWYAFFRDLGYICEWFQKKVTKVYFYIIMSTFGLIKYHVVFSTWRFRMIICIYFWCSAFLYRIKSYCIYLSNGLDWKRFCSTFVLIKYQNSNLIKEGLHRSRELKCLLYHIRWLVTLFINY